jgi:hypothetical protein
LVSSTIQHVSLLTSFGMVTWSTLIHRADRTTFPTSTTLFLNASVTISSWAPEASPESFS